VAPIFLAAPTSGADRIRKIGALTRGFLYYVSVTGITGARTGLPEDLKTALAQVRALVNCPLAVGFGISTPAQVADLAPLVDGIVVGSAIVQKIACRQDSQVIAEIGDFVAELKAPLRS
jgi:tryptophan synthase alpha chain